ncbi:MAG: hypothetical protein F6K21_26925 [Symploca sp. SIO2D2]|nr:hypothetical protein [Symploca sp. SIO2D2]
MEESIPQSLEFSVYALILVSILLNVWNAQTSSQLLSISNRWMRWLTISLAGAVLCMDWLERPFWSVALIFFLLWLLLETVYTWFMVSALSQSEFSLFPRFKENTSGEEWPANKKLIEIRDWLRASGYKKSQALVADIGGGAAIRSSIYQDKANTTRIQILFIPQAKGAISYCFSFSSETADGKRLVTDNLNMPYGGFYPENWEIVRKPWSKSIDYFSKLHSRRIQDLDLENYETEPVQDLNNQQQLLERTNIEAGFLFPPHMQEEQGRITWEGRYRVWKEIWMLNYLGRVFN